MAFPKRKLSPAIARAKALKRAQRQQKTSAAKAEKADVEAKQKALEAQIQFVGFSAQELAGREIRQFTKDQILSILREYNRLPQIRGARAEWLRERKLTTAHISIWKKRLRTGGFID